VPGTINRGACDFQLNLVYIHIICKNWEILILNLGALGDILYIFFKFCFVLFSRHLLRDMVFSVCSAYTRAWIIVDI